MKVLYKPEMYDGMWRVKSENAEETAVLNKICVHHNLDNSEFAVKTSKLVEHNLLGDETPSPLVRVRQAWEIRTIEGNVFLGVRHDHKAALVDAERFSKAWPPGCVVVPFGESIRKPND